MKIICLVKFIPDVDNFIYDYENNILVRENVNLILNPDDACALAYALKLKKSRSDVTVEILTMAPIGIREHLKDLLRIRADRAVLISDPMYVGSDTYATSRVIARYLKSTQYDVILTGTHSLDGGTAHVPVQVAELLKLNHMSHIIRFDDHSLLAGTVEFESDLGSAIAKFKLELPAVLGVSRESKYKLPFVRYEDLNLDVDDKISVITNQELGFSEDEVGLAGSLTKVARTYQPQLKQKENITVGNDDAGIEVVYQFLKEGGYL